jgi:hypothetical protein
VAAAPAPNVAPVPAPVTTPAESAPSPGLEPSAP